MWWRRLLVGAGLAAPVAVVLVVAWPDRGPSAPAPVDIHAGDDRDGSVGPGAVTAYTLADAADGTAVAVRGLGGFDSTLRVVDADSGEELASNDDSADGLDPAVVLDLPEPTTVRIEVRGFGGAPGAYVISVEAPS